MCRGRLESVSLKWMMSYDDALNRSWLVLTWACSSYVFFPFAWFRRPQSHHQVSIKVQPAFLRKWEPRFTTDTALHSTTDELLGIAVWLGDSVRLQQFAKTNRFDQAKRYLVNFWWHKKLCLLRFQTKRFLQAQTWSCVFFFEILQGFVIQHGRRCWRLPGWGWYFRGGAGADWPNCPIAWHHTIHQPRPSSPRISRILTSVNHARRRVQAQCSAICQYLILFWSSSLSIILKLYKACLGPSCFKLLKQLDSCGARIDT